MTSTIIVFIKNIVPGKVKTRLAETVGDEKAVAIYRALLERTREEVLKVQVNRCVYYSDFIERDDGWDEKDFDKKVQRGEDIGDRMSNAIQDMLSHSGKVVLIGGDIVGLKADILRTALEKLGSHDVVLGPSKDGGYYLIGMKEPVPEAFKNIHWSTDRVARQTMDRMYNMNKSCFLLPTLTDIDYGEDWEEYGWEL